MVLLEPLEVSSGLRPESIRNGYGEKSSKISQVEEKKLQQTQKGITALVCSMIEIVETTEKNNGRMENGGKERNSAGD